MGLLYERQYSGIFLFGFRRPRLPLPTRKPQEILVTDPLTHLAATCSSQLTLVSSKSDKGIALYIHLHKTTPRPNRMPLFWQGRLGGTPACPSYSIRVCSRSGKQRPKLKSMPMGLQRAQPSWEHYHGSRERHHAASAINHAPRKCGAEQTSSYEEDKADLLLALD